MKPYDVPTMPLKGRMAYLWVERGCLEVLDSALVVADVTGVRSHVPVGALGVLLLEPGVTVTHAAVKLCAESQTLLLWVGEGGVRLYSAGQTGSQSAYKLLRQARLALGDTTRLAVARAMYGFRFGEPAPKRRSIEQIRGMEGARVKVRYRELSAEFDVPWTGRDYDRSDWSSQDLINRCLSAANSCLYGLCHAAILMAGYSPALGFVHTGYAQAFVHDIADLYKMDVAAPVAFQIVAERAEYPVRTVRHELRDRFRREGTLERIIPDIERVLAAGEHDARPPDEIAGVRIVPSEPGEAPWYAPDGIAEPPPRWKPKTPPPASPHGDAAPARSLPTTRSPVPGDGLPF
jgi:CRISPR-associated protein Cas1